MSENKLYPLFLKMDGRKILIVGGGMIALQKVVGLLNTDAQITVIAPMIIDELRACRGEFPNIKNIKFLERDYQYGDEKDYFMVIAATNILELNNSIANRCRDQGILVNSVDQAEYCDFYVPSIVEAGDIKIAISTNGKAPSVAQKMRLELQKLMEQRYLTLVEAVTDFREKVQEKIQGEQQVSRRAKLVCWFTDRKFAAMKERG